MKKKSFFGGRVPFFAVGIDNDPLLLEACLGPPLSKVVADGTRTRLAWAVCPLQNRASIAILRNRLSPFPAPPPRLFLPIFSFFDCLSLSFNPLLLPLYVVFFYLSLTPHFLHYTLFFPPVPSLVHHLFSFCQVPKPIDFADRMDFFLV